MTQKQLIQRIEKIERQLEDVQRNLQSSGPGVAKSSRDFVGMFHNDTDFKEAMKIGAAYRRSLRPKGKPRKK